MERASKNFKCAPKIAQTSGIFKKDYLHIMVFEVFRQFFGFVPWLGKILVLSQLPFFDVFSDGLVTFLDQFEVFS